jgi:hypothetical protein
MSENVLITIPFYGQSIFASLINDVPHVAMKPICENIGLDWSSQLKKIKRNPILDEGMVMITIPSNGGLQEMIMLPVKYLNGWLFSVDAIRVKSEIRGRLISYQRECFEVLANHFIPKLNEAVADGQLSEFLKPITEPITLEDFNWRKQVLFEALENLKKAYVLMTITVSGKELLAGKWLEK